MTVETTYEDALRLWVLVHDPANAGSRPVTDARLRKLVTDAIATVEAEYAPSPTKEGQE